MVRATRFSVAVALGVASGSALGQEGLGHAAWPGVGDARAVPEHVLDEQRAGFIGQDGIRIDIGLEHLTSVNGEVVYRSVLRALGPMDGADAQPREALEKIAVLTSIGEGGIYSQLSDGGGWTTAIQNSLDGQSIEHRVVVDLQLSNLPTLRSDLGRALERQLADAISSF